MGFLRGRISSESKRVWRRNQFLLPLPHLLSSHPPPKLPNLRTSSAPLNPFSLQFSRLLSPSFSPLPPLPSFPPIYPVSSSFHSPLPLPSSSSSSPFFSTATQNPPKTSNTKIPISLTTPIDPLDLSNAQNIFSKLTTGELASALLNLEMASNEKLVDLGTFFLKSPLMKSKILSFPLLKVVKNTAYSHFCAGETVEEAAKTLQRMWDLGLKGILDFSVEDAHNFETCEKNLEGFLRTIRQIPELPEGSVSYACVKLTALCPLSTLEKVSSLLRYHYLHPENKPPWLLPSLPIFSPESPMYRIASLSSPPPPLSPEEEREFFEAHERLRKICLECESLSVPLLIDAEYFSVEPAIDHLAFAVSVEFNRKYDFPLVYGTIQCYLKDSMSRLSVALEEAKERKIPFGVKLVRGAYLGREKKMAEREGGESPIHETIEETHKCYDLCAARMLEEMGERERSPVGVVLATHNYGSGRAAVLKAEEVGVKKTNPRFNFAQLKGMADGLSLSLSLSGYNVSKYLPYGKVEEVIPYLIRRAEENRGVLGNTGGERRRIRQELGRRCRASLGMA